MFESLDTSVSGLVAHRIWHDTIVSNVANVSTTRDAQGRPNPYKRRFPIFRPVQNAGTTGVEVVSVEAAEGFNLLRDPNHPDAIKTGPNAGMVRMPKVDWHKEMVNAMIAQRAYEANLTALQVTKEMYSSDLRILA